MRGGAGVPVVPFARSPLASTLTIALVALGVGILGAYALDWHGHTCDQCGNRWKHLGALNGGDEKSHTCARCGTIQWWKCGFSPQLRSAA